MNSNQFVNLVTLFRFTTTYLPVDDRISNEALNFGSSVVHNTLIIYGGYVQ